MIRKCTHCEQEKPLEKFVRQGNYYRYKCKECLNATLRTGKPNSGRFQKGHTRSIGQKITEETRRKISATLKGNIPWNKGKKASSEIIKKMSEVRLGKSTWNKGLLKSKRRFADLYKVWRNRVKERDGYKCQRCESEKKLHVHHIIPWKENESLRFDLENGITLCMSCHMKEEWKTRPPMSEETKKKIGIAGKGRPPWNKGLKK